jgi:hypothetical protein
MLFTLLNFCQLLAALRTRLRKRALIHEIRGYRHRAYHNSYSGISLLSHAGTQMSTSTFDGQVDHSSAKGGYSFDALKPVFRGYSLLMPVENTDLCSIPMY